MKKKLKMTREDKEAVLKTMKGAKTPDMVIWEKMVIAFIAAVSMAAAIIYMFPARQL